MNNPDKILQDLKDITLDLSDRGFKVVAHNNITDNKKINIAFSNNGNSFEFSSVSDIISMILNYTKSNIDKDDKIFISIHNAKEDSIYFYHIPNIEEIYLDLKKNNKKISDPWIKYFNLVITNSKKLESMKHLNIYEEFNPNDFRIKNKHYINLFRKNGRTFNNYYNEIKYSVEVKDILIDIIDIGFIYDIYIQLESINTKIKSHQYESGIEFTFTKNGNPFKFPEISKSIEHLINYLEVKYNIKLKNTICDYLSNIDYGVISGTIRKTFNKLKDININNKMYHLNLIFE